MATSEQLALQLMEEFAVTTGVTGARPPRRYLWTDGFAVCNFVALKRLTGQSRFLQLAVELVQQVHHVLGCHRPDDSRTGWISGLPEREGERHPTCGGLRIGKPLNERGLHERPDPRLEWEQDGQYFHYLTKWMHALCRMCRETKDEKYWRWAAELAVAAQRAFTVKSMAGHKRLVWKMSIDLSRPLVSSSGQHDAVDGLVTCLDLQAATPLNAKTEVDLAPTISELSVMCVDGRWATDDALGIGGMLDDAMRLTKLVFQQNLAERELLYRILVAATGSLQAFDVSSLHVPASHRLAFRELGLAIGLTAIVRVGDLAKTDPECSEFVRWIMNFQPLGEEIIGFWSEQNHRVHATWTDHCDINSVMLATSLLPKGCSD